jgi:general secretion pathway protein I
MNAPLHQAGFSLIEVMVAILIMGIALVGLTHGITTALDSSKESEQQTVAALFASGKIETLRAEGGLENGETDGDCGAGLTAYRWKQTISDTGIDGLHDVDVVVQTARNSQEIYELKTLLFESSDSSSGSSSNNSGNGDDKSKKKKGGAS